MTFTAQQLGQMNDEELRSIRHCDLCLESYANCQCKRGVERRRKYEDPPTWLTKEESA